MGKMRGDLLVFLLAVLCSCSAVPEKHYFTMSYVLLPNKSRVESLFPYTLRVRQLDIGVAYDTERIVYRYSPYEFQYYNFMIWAAKPQKMLTDLVVRHLQHAKLFGDVAFDFDERAPDYELFGTVFAIEELDSGDQWYAHLAINLRMTRYRGEKVVWSHDINVKKQVYNKAPVYVVKALSELIESEMGKVVDRLEKFLRAEADRERTGS